MNRDMVALGEGPTAECSLRAYRDQAAVGTFRDNAAWINVNRADDMNGQCDHQTLPPVNGHMRTQVTGCVQPV
jgi:hypothetical protein